MLSVVSLSGASHIGFDLLDSQRIGPRFDHEEEVRETCAGMGKAAHDFLLFLLQNTSPSIPTPSCHHQEPDLGGHKGSASDRLIVLKDPALEQTCAVSPTKRSRGKAEEFAC
jgi:hypothetical protein